MKDKKRRLRKELGSRWNSLNGTELRRLSAETEKTVCASSEWREAGTILAYLAFGKEISLDGLILQSLEKGKAVFVPLITGKGIMEFRRIVCLERVKKNAWGIREPYPDSEPFEPFDPALAGKILVLTPGLGFSPAGRRMGRGGGYYDRFLEHFVSSEAAPTASPDIMTMGICWVGVLLEDIPAEEHDRPVDMVCCGNRILRPRQS